MDSQPFSFWLLPGDAERTQLAQLIRDLAARHGSRPFAPHVTIYGGVHTPQDDLPEILRQVVRGLGPMALRVRGLDCTDQFFKSLFIDLAEHPALTLLSQRVRAALARPVDYQLQPHLSLIYANLPAADKRRIIDSLPLDLAEIRFDEVALVTPADPARGWHDIEGWQFPWRCRLDDASA